jgi:hypothetical protein
MEINSINGNSNKYSTLFIKAQQTKIMMERKKEEIKREERKGRKEGERKGGRQEGGREGKGRGERKDEEGGLPFLIP